VQAASKGDAFGGEARKALYGGDLAEKRDPYSEVIKRIA
jgi:hypothetical protein